MSLLAASCAIALQLEGACDVPAQPVVTPDDHDAIAEQQLTDIELAQVRGEGLLPVGLDQAEAAARAESVDFAFVDRTSNQMRDLFDNWAVQVATPLIADATRGAPG